MVDESDAEVLERLLASRFSCRGFTDEPVAEAEIEAIVASASRTPSWCNVQPWHVDIVSGEALVRLRHDLMADASLGSDYPFPPGYEGVHAERRREVGWQLYQAVGVAKGDREGSAREMLRNFEFFGAPHVAVVSAPAPLGVYAAIDCGLFVQSFLLAAQARGVATVAQAALAQKSQFLREWLGLPEDRLIVCGISFGHADPDHPANSFRAGRAPLHEVTRFHR
ncbi:nitroreductase [Aeromicrobium tamlense]|uniref:Nitroreductase n=1 Tax=Aeromicrobium tamlense TaxID=375541 RepID=A0A8I0KHU0_9ACTN|nr:MULTISPECIES: nitroreductase [Aeromicrobium]MBD1269885.1 nitroreductase [Aeromicrobium tamlense]NYI39458.1 nitroreductase [Aeromicrobium tamlense]